MVIQSCQFFINSFAATTIGLERILNATRTTKQQLMFIFITNSHMKLQNGAPEPLMLSKELIIPEFCEALLFKKSNCQFISFFVHESFGAFFLYSTNKNK